MSVVSPVIDISASDEEIDLTSNQSQNSGNNNNANININKISNVNSGVSNINNNIKYECCPVCGSNIKEAEFSSHVSQCLESKTSISSNTMQKQLLTKLELLTSNTEAMGEILSSSSTKLLNQCKPQFQQYYHTLVNNLNILNTLFPTFASSENTSNHNNNTNSHSHDNDHEMKTDFNENKLQYTSSSASTQPIKQLSSTSTIEPKSSPPVMISENKNNNNSNSSSNQRNNTNMIPSPTPSGQSEEELSLALIRELQEQEENDKRRAAEARRQAEEQATLDFLRLNNSCALCGQMKDDLHSADQCEHKFCTDCLRQYLLSLLTNPKAITCPVTGCENQHLPDRIQRRVLNKEQFEKLQHQSFQLYVDTSGKFVKCVNCTYTFEALAGIESLSNNETDNDGKPLTQAAKQDRAKNRFRCPQCSNIFCANCKVNPYHLGYTCEEYAKYKVSKHCRFCAEALTKDNQSKTTAADKPGLLDVCTNKECLERKNNSCEKMLSCGHLCRGVKGEKPCLTCLSEDCKLNITKPSVNSEEFCNICFTEELGAAPCIQSGCGHIFHLHCVKGQLDKKWPSARITFNFLNCPLCKAEFSHPSLNTILQPLLKLKAEVKEKASQRLKFEGLEKDKDVVDASGKYYNKPAEYAMDRFAYYPCSKCKQAYFGGRRVCGEALDAEGKTFDSSELVCGGCTAGSNAENCKKHGKEYIDYKCKFCCEIATFFCWGTTHFCLASYSLVKQYLPNNSVQIVKIRDLKLGDYMLNELNKPVKITDVAYGKSPLYTVFEHNPNKSTNVIINSSFQATPDHILCLVWNYSMKISSDNKNAYTRYLQFFDTTYTLHTISKRFGASTIYDSMEQADEAIWTELAQINQIGLAKDKSCKPLLKGDKVEIRICDWLKLPRLAKMSFRQYEAENIHEIHTSNTPFKTNIINHTTFNELQPMKNHLAVYENRTWRSLQVGDSIDIAILLDGIDAHALSHNLDNIATALESCIPILNRVVVIHSIPFIAANASIDFSKSDLSYNLLQILKPIFIIPYNAHARNQIKQFSQVNSKYSTFGRIKELREFTKGMKSQFYSFNTTTNVQNSYNLEDLYISLRIAGNNVLPGSYSFDGVIPKQFAVLTCQVYPAESLKSIYIDSKLSNPLDFTAITVEGGKFQLGNGIVTHNCNTCHKKQETGDYVSKKKVSELPVCPGEKKCPLGVKHPPNGTEFILGCGLCRQRNF